MSALLPHTRDVGGRAEQYDFAVCLTGSAFSPAKTFAAVVQGVRAWCEGEVLKIAIWSAAICLRGRRGRHLTVKTLPNTAGTGLPMM